MGPGFFTKNFPGEGVSGDFGSAQGKAFPFLYSGWNKCFWL
ncbi:hypothetical protein LEP1GSC172_2574 [Leptospira noguchii]|uniref:Uncharacterized protein n=2 Tax=Leptospira noguchii TaxID=28182 RepID=T0GYM0_9LEPT|nr:hypothetical protein LEP1GSC172_2574 [Leptospira noguchii]EQA72421.1 hypothetical protein LEP1GSC059_0760 [Leptospira noguchii serovar Panama str. CZ214]